MLQTVDTWVPHAVIRAADQLHAKFVEQGCEEGLKILSRLIVDLRMRVVWQQLYSKKREKNIKSPPAFAYPALTLKDKAEILRRRASDIRKSGTTFAALEANVLDAEANAALDAYARSQRCFPDSADATASDLQDFAVTCLFNCACNIAVDIPSPTYVSEVKTRSQKACKIYGILSGQKIELIELGLWDEANKLDDVIAQCSDLIDLDADHLEAGDPTIFARVRGDPEIRAYVVQLYDLTLSLFGSPLYGILARIANVVFDCKMVTRAAVREWLS